MRSGRDYSPGPRSPPARPDIDPRDRDMRRERRSDMSSNMQATTLFAEMIKKKNLRDKFQQRQNQKRGDTSDVQVIEDGPHFNPGKTSSPLSLWNLYHHLCFPYLAPGGAPPYGHSPRMVPAPGSGAAPPRVPHHGVANGEFGRGLPATGVPVRPPQPGSKPHRPGKNTEEGEGQTTRADTNKFNQLMKSKTILTKVIKALEGTLSLISTVWPNFPSLSVTGA